MENISENLSWYQLSAPLRQTARPLSQDNNRVDICIVGAGLTGLNAALELKAKGFTVAILEAEYVGYGASGRNGGQIASGYAPGMRRTEKIVGRQDAEKLWTIAEEAKQLLRRRIKDHDIACDLASGEMMCAAKKCHVADLEAEAEFCQSRYGYEQFEICSKSELAGRLGSDKYFGGLLDHAGGHLNPVKLVRGLADAAHAAGVKIYENSKVCGFSVARKITVKTENAQITCDNLILAANVYMDGLSSNISRNFMPVGTYILATEPLGEELAHELIPENFCVNDTKNILDYYRLSPDGRLLYGGRDSPTEPGADLEKKMRKLMLDTFPQLRHVETPYLWGGTAAVTLNRLPDIGRIGDNIYYAQGFSGQGVTLSGQAGKILAEAIAADTGKFDVFSRIPHKSLPGGRMLRLPALRLAMFWYQLCDMV